MRLLAAPDKFRGTLTAREAAAAIAAGGECAGWSADELPLADGGEGTLEVLGGGNRRATVTGPREGQVALATWKLMLDNGSMQDGEKHLRATARTPVCRVSPAAASALGAMVTLEGDRGSITLPTEATHDMPDGVAWVPANSTGNGVLADLASPGSGVHLKGGGQ